FLGYVNHRYCVTQATPVIANCQTVQKKPPSFFCWRLFRNLGGSVRTTLPFLHQRCWKSKKIKEESVDGTNHEKHVTTGLRHLTRQLTNCGFWISGFLPNSFEVK